MPHVRVCIAGCPPYTGTVHNFPPEVEKERRELWFRQFGKCPYNSKARVLFACHRHFSSRMRLGKKLHRRAYPDQNLRPYDPNKPYTVKSVLPPKNAWMESELRRSPPIEYATIKYDMAVINKPLNDIAEGEDVIVVQSGSDERSILNKELPTPKCLLKCADSRVLYRLPTKLKSLERRKQWFFLLGMDHNIYSSNNIYLCDQHFDEDMLDPSRDPQTVCPNKNLPPPLQDSIAEDMEGLTTCIQNCTDYRRKYSFPSNETDMERRKMWLIKFGRDPEFYNHDIYACDRHFSDAMRSDRYLISSAIPDQNIRAFKGVLEQGSSQNYRQITDLERANIRQQIEKQIKQQRFKWKQHINGGDSAYIPPVPPQISVTKESNILDSLNTTIIKSDEPSETLSYVKLNTLGIFVPSRNGYVESVRKVLTAEDPLDLHKQIPFEWIEPIEPTLNLKVHRIEKADYEREYDENECYKYDYNEGNYNEYDEGEYECDKGERFGDELRAIPTRSLTPIEGFLDDPENKESWNYYAQQKPQAEHTEAACEDDESSMSLLRPAKVKIIENFVIDGDKTRVTTRTADDFSTSYANYLKTQPLLPIIRKRVWSAIDKKYYYIEENNSTPQTSGTSSNLNLEIEDSSPAKRRAGWRKQFKYAPTAKQNLEVKEDDSLETILKKCYALTASNNTTNRSDEKPADVKVSAKRYIIKYTRVNATKSPTKKTAPEAKLNTSNVATERQNNSKEHALEEIATPVVVSSPLIEKKNTKVLEYITPDKQTVFTDADVANNITNLLNNKPLDERTNSVAYGTSWQQVVDLVQKGSGANEVSGDDMLTNAVLNGTSWQQVREIIERKHHNSDMSKAVRKILNEAESNAPTLTDVSSVELGKPEEGEAQKCEVGKSSGKQGTSEATKPQENKVEETSEHVDRPVLENREENKAQDSDTDTETETVATGKSSGKQGTSEATKPQENKVEETSEHVDRPVLENHEENKAQDSDTDTETETLATEPSTHKPEENNSQENETEQTLATKTPTHKPEENNSTSDASTTAKGVVNAIKDPKMPVVLVKVGEQFLLINRNNKLEAKNLNAAQRARELINPTQTITSEEEISKVVENKSATATREASIVTKTIPDKITPKAFPTTIVAVNKLSSKALVGTSVKNSANVKMQQQGESLLSDDVNRKKTESVQKRVNSLLNDDLTAQQVEDSLLDAEGFTEQLFERLLNDDNERDVGECLLNDVSELEAEIILKDHMSEPQPEILLNNDVTEQQVESLLKDKGGEETADSLLGDNLKNTQPESLSSDKANEQETNMVLTDVKNDMTNTKTATSPGSTSAHNIQAQDTTKLSNDSPTCVMECQNIKTLFAFPSCADAMLRRHFWFLQVGLDLNAYWHKTLYICNNHFDANMFVNPDILNQYAYPSEELKGVKVLTLNSVATQTNQLSRSALLKELKEWQTMEHRASNEITRLKLLIRLKQEAARILNEINSDCEILDE